MLICQFASNVVINYALMSKSMTGAEVENCAEVLSWFNEVHVELRSQYLVDANGRFEDSEQKHNIGATRWACPNDAMGLLERCGTESARRRKDARRCKQFKLWRTDGRGAGGAIPRVGVDNRNREGKFIRAAQQQPQQ
ncbi:hypothetical protein niasHS_007952 [Heterodera schachtii]|uniref:Uncharacterized protein n=1 Tax=Heterodera schachtii TaxID=97005 RepID=A0ABD2JQ74_HETSC